MNFQDWPWWAYLLLSMGGFFLLAMALAAYLLKKVPKANIREDAGFMETLRGTPFLVVVFLDVLDLGLDSFGAPIAWWVLGRLGFDKLKGFAVAESFIPGTGVLPTMTASWVVSRVLPQKSQKLLEEKVIVPKP